MVTLAPGIDACLVSITRPVILEVLVCATAMGVTIRKGKTFADGVWDARGTLAVDRAAPVGLTEITLRFDIDSDADQAKLERMIQTTERYLGVQQDLTDAPCDYPASEGEVTLDNDTSQRIAMTRSNRGPD